MDPIVFISVFGGKRAKNTGVSLHVQQFRGMFVKRLIHSWRNRILTIVQIVVPIVFTILACLPVNNISSKHISLCAKYHGRYIDL